MHTTLNTRDDDLLSALHGAEALYCAGTATHSVRVGLICGLLAETLGLSTPDIDAMGWVGVLHDIGKLAVPVKVLRKKGPLTADEWEDVKKHPAVGSDLVLAFSPGLAPVARGIRAHHERWNGSGYPDARDGFDIPVFGRIVAISDVFDALTHRRGYREGKFSHREAVEFVIEGANRAFDPELVRVFAELDRRGALPRREPDRPEAPLAALGSRAQPATD
jgi:HD-GYP domain-containing protein (c-di-GMP phosphodiesterase class II)